MRITVETGKWAARYVEEPLIVMDIDDGSTVLDVIEEIGIPEEEAGMAVVGDTGVAKDYVLNDGDFVKIHPVIIGG